MSLNHSNSDIAGIAIPQLYFLQMDSGFSIRTSDSQVFPLHILNNSSEYSHNQLFRPKSTREEQGQDQSELLIDLSQDSAFKFVALQIEKGYQQNQKSVSSPSTSQCASSKESSVEISGTQLIAPSLVNPSESPIGKGSKKQLIQNYVHISDRSVLPRAIAVLPGVLQIRRKEVISPRRTLPPRARFGPLQGVKQKMTLSEANQLTLAAAANKTPLFVLKDEDKLITHIDVSDKDKSNWIGLLPLGDENSANVWVYEENYELYIITTEVVPSRKQLMLGYSQKYAQDYGLIGPTKDIDTESPLKQRSWWCYECQRAFPSASLLQRHMDADHQEEYPVPRRRYRCRHCTRTFSRIFTLRRHVARHCDKKLAKSDNIISTDPLPEATLNSSLNTEDNRIPSDESFQNYSNGLDFSTNLFDTDRMPILDMSGNSRLEFNPYGLDSEIPSTNDLGYANGCSSKPDEPSSDNEKKSQAKDIKSPSIPCPYCNEVVVKGKRRQHVRECTARRFECQCKKTFANKELLEQHIYVQHSNEAEAEKKDAENNALSTDTAEKTMQYECEQCQHAFKRRGMLVNHLWRVHKTEPARVPLVRRIRHYPCVVCPKIYRTAAKRNRHVKVHHPGAEHIRAQPVEGGSRECAPAACPACPRQYTTRAKLLQHQRCYHPHLVPSPPKKTNLKQKSNDTNDRLNASEELLKHKTSLQQLLNFY